MKRLYIFLTVLTLTLFINIAKVDAALVYGDLDFITYSDSKYNLTTGVKESDILYSTTNKINIPLNNDGYLYFDSIDFHHILFFDSYNAYMGYGNSLDSDLELSSYLGVDVSASKIPIPDRARKFALMTYDFNDNPLLPTETHDLVAPEGFITDTLSGLDTVVKPDTNLFDREFTVSTTGVNYTQVSRDTFTIEVVSNLKQYTLDLFPNIVYEPNTQYTFSGIVDDFDPDFVYTRLAVVYTDASVESIWTHSEGAFEFTTNASKTVDKISFSYNLLDGFATISNFQIEEGTIASAYVPYISDSEWSAYTSLTYKEIFEDLEQNTIGKNLFDKTSRSIDLGISISTGNTFSSSSVDSTDYIKILDTSTYYVSHLKYGAWYDVNKNFISGLTGTNIITPPTNAVYLRYTIQKEYIDIFQIELGSTSTNYEPYFTYNNDFSAEPLYSDIYTWYNEYKLYKSTENPISIVDIGESNLIENSIFANGVTNWVINGATGGVTGGVYSFTAITLKGRIYQQHSSTSGDLYVVASVKSDSNLVGISESTSILEKAHSGSGEYELLSYIETTPNGFVSITDFRSSGWTQVDVASLFVYNLTDIFSINGADSEPDKETFEIYLDYYNDNLVDPYLDSYDLYYNTANLLTLNVKYQYDDTPPAPEDMQTSFDDSLTKMGVEGDSFKVFLAFLIMGLAAIIIGLKTSNSLLVIMTEIILVIAFTLLGWFSFWILLLIALIFALVFMRNVLQGGK